MFLLSSVESGDIDLSEYQDQDANGENVDDTDDAENPGNGDEDQQNGSTEPASATAGTCMFFLFLVFILKNHNKDHVAANDNGAAAAPKLVISEEEYDRITQALVIRLRQHEETVNKDSKQHQSLTFSIPFIPLLQLLKQINYATE